MVDTAGRPPLLAGLASEVKDRVLPGKGSQPRVFPGRSREGSGVRRPDWMTTTSHLTQAVNFTSMWSFMIRLCQWTQTGPWAKKAAGFPSYCCWEARPAVFVAKVSELS